MALTKIIDLEEIGGEFHDYGFTKPFYCLKRRGNEVKIAV